MMKGLLSFGCALLMACGAFGSGRDTLLIVGDAPSRNIEKMNRLLLDGLAERGFPKQRYVVQNDLSGDDLASAKLVLFFGRGSASYSLAGHDRRVVDALASYVEDGGGLVVFPALGQCLNLSAFTEHLMNALGGGILTECPVIPSDRYVSVGTRGKRHIYTDRILWPGTDAKRVLVNAEFQFNTAHCIQGCRIGNGWTTVLSAGADVAGEPFPETGIAFWDSRRTDTPTAGDYPLVAVREFGAGRAVWFGVMASRILYCDTNGDSAVAEKMRAALFDGAPGGGKSDLFELIADVFGWAAAGGRKDAAAAKRPAFASLKPLAEEEAALGLETKVFRGVIGPRTTHSTGRSTPAEYVAKAKALGHDFIVFLEDFEHLTPQGFDALLKECEELTDGSFTAWAGYTIQNEDGNREFVFTREPMYPAPKFLTADGRRLARRRPGSKGAIGGACAELRFYYGAFGFNANVGWYAFEKSPYRRTDMRAAMSMGVFVRENGVETARSLGAYAINCDNNQAPLPVGLELVESADMLGEGSFRSEIAAEGVAAFRKAMVGYTAFTIFSGYPGMGTFGHYSTTSGPEVSLDLPRCDPADDGTRLYNPKLSRWPLALSVRSKAGVDTVELWDGDRLARRWKGNGAKEFEQRLTLSAETQHHYWARVTDTAGGEAITRAAGCVSLLLSEFNCGDRMNQYLDAKQVRGNGEPPFVMQRGGETCLPDKGPWTGRVRPVGCFVFDKKWGIGGSGGGDGSPEDHPQVKFTPSLSFGDEKPANIGWTSEFVAGRAGGPHAEPRRVVAGPNALVADRVLDGVFPLAEREVIHVWHSLYPVEDCEWAETEARNSFFLPKIDGIVAYQWEQTLTLKKDVPVPSDGSPLAWFGNVRKSQHTVSFNAHVGGKTIPGALGKSFDMAPGDAIVAKDSLWGSLAIVALTPVHFEKGRFGAPAAAKGGVAKAGTTFAFKAALIGMHKGVKDPDAFTMDEIIPKYAAFAPQGGVIRDETARDGAIVETFSGLKDLPGTLGLRLSGMSDNRSAVLALPDGRIRLVPVEKGVAYVALGDEESGKELFIGHPVRCDNPDVGLYLSLGKDLKTWQLEAHNPTDGRQTARISTDPRFAGFVVSDTLDLAPGESRVLECAKRLTMRISFDGTAEADFAAGGNAPVAAEGLTFGEGRFGGAVRLDTAAKSRLAYAAAGNVDVKRGTISFWAKRDGSGGAWPKPFVSFPKGVADGWGRFSFSFESPSKMSGRRDDEKGYAATTARCVWPDAGDGEWEHWIVTWGVRSRAMTAYRGGDGSREFRIYHSDEESFRIMPKHVEAAFRFAADAARPERFFLGCGEKGGAAFDGWIDEVRIYDRAFTPEEVKAAFEGDREAAVAWAPHYGVADEERTLEVELDPRGGSLDGAVIELADLRTGGIVASATCAPGAKSATLAATLPMGEYEYRIVKGGRIVARDSYTALRRGNPYELPATATPGVPARLRYVKTVKPDLATLTADDFRAVGKCAMRELDGQTYLEGGSGDKDRFAVRFSLPTNVPLYLLEIVYPDDRYRSMDLMVQAAKDVVKPGSGHGGGEYGFAQGIATGGEFPNSGKMLSHKCLYWSGKSEDLAFVAMAWQPGAPAAVSEIRIFEVVDGALPVADVRPPAGALGDAMGRQFGQFWEDPAVTGAMRFNMADAKSFSEQIDRYAAVMRYCGQNVLSYPGGWYKGLITAANDPRPNTHADHFLEGYYAKFEREGLFVMPSIEFIHSVNPPDIDPTPETLTNGSLHATQYPIHADGLPPPKFNHGLPPVVNFLHPETQREIEEMVRTLVREGAPYRSFKGLSVQLYRDGACWWGDIKSGYNDYCIDAFERDTGIRVPCDRSDPLRGKAYYEWIMANCRERWIDWRCDKFAEFWARMGKILSDARPDLRLWFIAATKYDAVSDLGENPDYFEEGFASRALRDAGFDGAKLAAAIPNAILGGTVHPMRHRKRWYWGRTERERGRYRGLPATEGYYREIQKGAFPHVTCRDEFMEWRAPKAGEDSPSRLSGGWFVEKAWRCSTINAAGVNAMRYFAVPLRFGDVLGFTRGSFLVCDYGYEPLEARFAQAFRALPDEKMSDWPFESEAADVVRVRSVEKAGRRWFYAVNTEAAPAQVVFETPCEVRDLVSGETFAGGTVRIPLAPYELRSFVGDAARPRAIAGERLVMDSNLNQFDPNPSRFESPAFQKECGFNAVALRVDGKPLAVTALFDKYDPRVFPEGGEARAWVVAERKRFGEKISAAKAEGLTVLVNTDIIVLPRRMKELYGGEICGADGRIDFMKPKTQEIYRAMIAEFFDTFPELDGIVVRTGETYTFRTPFHGGNGPCDYWNDLEGSKDAHATLMNLLREEVCARRGKTCVYRTWDFNVFHTRPSYYLDVTSRVAPHEKFLISVKHCAGDFFRGVDFNRTLGIGAHRQIVEVQCQREFEGKGAMPTYVAASVIDGFEEHEGTEKPHSLRALAESSPLFAGVWTWSRGGGWVGPCIQNEFWCELNARVMAAWARDPGRSEADSFAEAARSMGVLPESVETLHRLALLTPKAFLRGKSATDAKARAGLFLGNMRDVYLCGLDRLLNEDWFYNRIIDGSIDGLLADRREAVKIWEEIVELAKAVKCRDKAMESYILTSSLYGLRLFRMIEAGWDVMATGLKGDMYGHRYDTERLAAGIARYDRAKADYLNLPKERPDSATLFTDDFVRIKVTEAFHEVTPVPGLGESVSRYRRLLPPQ